MRSLEISQKGTAQCPGGKANETAKQDHLGADTTVSFCTGKVVVQSTINVLSYVDTWKEGILPLFLALWMCLGVSPLQMTLEFTLTCSCTQAGCVLG